MLKLIFLYYLGCHYYISSFKTKIKISFSFIVRVVICCAFWKHIQSRLYDILLSYTHRDFDTLDKGVSAFYVECFIKIGLDYQAMLMVLQSMMLIVLAAMHTEHNH